MKDGKKSRPSIHKVVRLIYAYMLPQMAPPVRHPPSKITTFFKNKPTDDIDGGILATGY
jgi:hypothetical protein